MPPVPDFELAPIADPAEWRALLAGAGRVALEQGWAYGEAVRRHHGQAVERLALRAGDTPRALVQSFGRGVLGLGRLTRILRGPAWIAGAPDPDSVGAVARALRARYGAGWRRLLLWMPELESGAATEAPMRQAGLRRVVTGYSSAWLDLAPDEAALRAGLAGSWRRALAAAERSGLSAAICADAAARQRQLDAYDSFRRRRFVGPPGAFVATLIECAAPEDGALVLAAGEGGRDIAGIVLLRHGAAATYYAGWTGDEGRRRNAHNLLLWRGLLALRAAGVRWLDLGGISAAAPGVARFKLGVGGRFFTLAGTYM